MIPPSSGRESEGQIATALSLLFPLSLLLSAFITSHFFFPLWHVSVYSPFVSALQPLSLHFPPLFLLRPSISLSFCSVIFALSSLSFLFSILFSWLERRLGREHTPRHARRLAHLSTYLPSVPQVITSQTHPHKHHINLGFELTNAQRHKNTYRLQYTSRPVEFDMLLRTRWV